MNINPGDYILWGLTQTENNIWIACFVKVDDLFPLADIEIDISQATEAIKTGVFPIEKLEKAGYKISEKKRVGSDRWWE